MKKHRPLQNWKNLMIWKETLGTFKNDFRKQTSGKFDHVSAVRVLFLLLGRGAPAIRAPPQSSTCTREKMDFPREHYHFSLRRIAAAMCRLSIREPVPFSSSNQEPRSGCASPRLSALRFLFFFFLLSRAGVKTPLTKVNSHQSTNHFSPVLDRRFIYGSLPLERIEISRWILTRFQYFNFNILSLSLSFW